MKNIKFLLVFVVVIFSLQSCKWFIGLSQGNFCEQHGYITDTNGVGISNVKITVLKSDGHLTTPEETNRFFYTDYNGYYNIYIDNSDSVYYMKMTHDDYIYPMLNLHRYPQISYAHLQQEDEEINFEMIKKGKVKIEGHAMCDEGDFYWLPNVKFSLLKRPNGNTAYPDTTGIKTYTDNDGYYYIEFEGNKNYEFFLKPEKDGYYYDGGWIYPNCGEISNVDFGYVIGRGFVMKKEK
jgi:hypothetical protein